MDETIESEEIMLIEGFEIENENLIDNRFILSKKIGEGLISIVYRCYDIKLKKYLAIKLIRDLVLKKYSKSIEKEIFYLNKINDFNISSKLHHYSLEGKKWDFLTKRYEKKAYLAMELMEKGELFDLIASKKTFPVKIALFFFKSLINSVKILHDLNIAHRDLKFENIVLDKNYNLKIIDFGFSTEIFNEKNEKIFHKDNCGTEKYRAPELNENKPYFADKADIFTLGVILFVMLKGNQAFSKAIQSDKCYKYIYKEDYKTFWTIVKEDNIPIEAVEIINRMLCYNSVGRISIEEIMKSEFYNGDGETKENVKIYFDQ